MYLDDEQYKEVMKYSIIPTIDFVVINKNRVLLWLRNNEPLKWVYYFPWWRIQKWETMNEAINRKFEEELWIKIDTKNLKFLWIYDDFFENSIYDWVSLQNLSITYIYNISDDEIKNIHIDCQHSSLKFFELKDDLNPRVKIRINDLQKII